MKSESYKNDPLFLVERHIVDSRKILTESCRGLSGRQQHIVEGIFNEFVPLIKDVRLLEQTLTADQINQLFTNIEQGATAAGGNRTMLGKGKDVATKANEIVNNIGKWLQNTTPVKAFDQKFEDLKANIKEKLGGDDSKIVGGLEKLAELAKENPGKTAAIIGILTAIASVAGGPVGGAIAGQVLRGSVELLKGEQLSTALGKGLKTAAYGWLAGKTFELIGDVLSKGVEIATSPFSQDLQHLDLSMIAEKTGMPFNTESVSAIGKPEDIQELRSIFERAVEDFEAGNFGAADAGFQQAAELNDYMNSMDYFIDAGLADVIDQNQQIMAIQQGASELFKGMSSAAQGAAAGASAYDKSGNPVDDKGKPLNSPESKPVATPKEALEYNLRPLTESQCAYLFRQITMLNHKMITEGVIWEAGEEPEGQKPSMMQKVMGKAAEFGKNLTTKVTASKLMSAWKSAGSPTDSDALADFLKQQGVNDQVVTQTYSGMKLPAPGTAKKVADVAAIKKEIALLGPKSAKQLADMLAKQLGAA